MKKKINKGFEDFIPDDYDPKKAHVLTKREMAKIGLPLRAFPTGDELVSLIKLERLNIQLTKSSIDYFKSAARRRGVAYQPLIRAAVDLYVNSVQTGLLPT